MKKITKQMLWLFILTILSGIVGYVIRVYFARNLTVSEYGLFYAVFSLLFFFAPFRDLGLSEASVFFINKYLSRKEKPKIKGVMISSFIPQLALGIIIALIFFFSREFLAIHFFKDPLAKPIISILSLLFAFETILPTINHLFSAYQKVIFFKLSEFLKEVSIFFSAFLLFNFLEQSYLVPSLSYLFGWIITILFGVFAFLFNFRDILETKAEITKELNKEMFLYALPIMFSTAAKIILSHSDIILLTLLRNSEEVGFYNIALPSFNILLLLISPLIIILFPRVSNLYHNGKDNEIKKMLGTLYNNFLMISLPAALLFFSFSDLIINVLFGSSYLSASPALKVFSVTYVFFVIQNINFAVIAGIGKVKERSRILYYGASLNAIFDLVLIYFFGFVGAAIGTSLSTIIMAFLSKRIVDKDYKVKIDVKTQIRTLYSGFIFLISIFLFKYLFKFSSVFLETLLVLIFSCSIYLVCLFTFKVLTKEKIYAVKKLFF